MLVYFLPFIVNNHYLLFQVSSGHNSVTIQNRTHVHMNFFCLESLILSHPKVVQIPPESPCMCVIMSLTDFREDFFILLTCIVQTSTETNRTENLIYYSKFDILPYIHQLEIFQNSIHEYFNFSSRNYKWPGFRLVCA